MRISSDKSHTTYKSFRSLIALLPLQITTTGKIAGCLTKLTLFSTVQHNSRKTGATSGAFSSSFILTVEKENKSNSIRSETVVDWPTSSNSLRLLKL